MNIPHLFKRKTFNDTLALILILGIPGLWLLKKWLPIPTKATGATIVAWTSVIRHYFRKAPPNGV